MYRILTFTGSSIGASMQHSSDESTYVTLVDFGVQSTGGHLSASLLSSASRYRRLKYIMTGTASATIQAFSGSSVS